MKISEVNFGRSEFEDVIFLAFSLTHDFYEGPNGNKDGVAGRGGRGSATHKVNAKL